MNKILIIIIVYEYKNILHKKIIYPRKKNIFKNLEIEFYSANIEKYLDNIIIRKLHFINTS